MGISAVLESSSVRAQLVLDTSVPFPFRFRFKGSLHSRNSGEPGLVLRRVAARCEQRIAITLAPLGNEGCLSIMRKPDLTTLLVPVLFATSVPALAQLAVETPRNSAVSPNQTLLQQGVTTAPVLGQVWDPRVVPKPGDTAGTPLVDFLTVGAQPADIPGLLGPIDGTLLCLDQPILLFNFTPGSPFGLPIPNNPALVGITFCSQGGYLGVNGPIRLGNAIDFTVGTQQAPVPDLQSFMPTSGDAGTVLTIDGADFGNDPDDICMMISDGSSSAFVRPSAASGTQITAEIVAVEPGLTSGQLMATLGDGETFAAVPGIPPGMTIESPGVWVWEATGEKTGTSTMPFAIATTPGSDTSDSPTTELYWGSVNEDTGNLELIIDGGPCPPGTRFLFGMHILLSEGPTISFDYLHEVTDSNLGTLVQCANRQCQVLQLSIFLKTGFILPCTTELLKDGSVKISLGPPSSQSFVAGVIGMLIQRPRE